jgi:hypothetical protein
MESKIIYTLLFVSLIIILCNCNSTQKHNNEIIINKCDSIIYELPEKASKSLLSKIKGKNVSFCGLIGNADDNRYTFSFSYNDKTLYSKRDTLLLQKTNVFLKLGDKYYPIVSDFDDIFSNIPRTEGTINDYNFCFITVNSRGEILEGFAY